VLGISMRCDMCKFYLIEINIIDGKRIEASHMLMRRPDAPEQIFRWIPVVPKVLMGG
jgi:hypothetical protein